MMKTELFRDLQSFNEERCVFEARLILSDRRRGVLVTPTMDEWVGIHIMERDDRLPRNKPTLYPVQNSTNKEPRCVCLSSEGRNLC